MCQFTVFFSPKMKMLATLFLALVLSLVSSTLGQEEEVCTPFDDLLAGTEYYCRYNFPTHKLNMSCLLKSCPLPSGLCPLTTDGCVNQTALNHAVTILNTCIGQTGLTCGINMSRIRLVPISWTIAQLVPTNVATGTCVQNSGHFDNFSKARFSVSQMTGSPISLHIRTPLTCEATYNCTFDVTPASFLRSLRGILPSFNTPRMTGSYSLNVSADVSMDLTTPTPSMVTLTDQSDVGVTYSNFVNCGGQVLNENVTDLINLGMNTMLKKSVATSAAVNFLSTYAALILKAAQINCP